MSLANGPVAGEAPEASGSAPSRLRLLLVAMASLVLLLGAVFGRHGLMEARQFRLERDRLQEEIARLQERNVAMEREVHALRTDPLAIERIAREELGLARKGEKLILLAPPCGFDDSAASALDAPPSAP